jgi:hypothetical protein
MHRSLALSASLVSALALGGCMTDTAPPRPLAQAAIQCGQSAVSADGTEIVFDACPPGLRPSYIIPGSFVGMLDMRRYGGEGAVLVATTVLNLNDRTCHVAKLARWEDSGRRLRVTTQMAMPAFRSGLGIALRDGACGSHQAGSVPIGDVGAVGRWRTLQ